MTYQRTGRMRKTRKENAPRKTRLAEAPARQRVRQETNSLDNLIAKLDEVVPAKGAYSVVYMTSGLCSVVRDGQTIATDLSNAQAWTVVDNMDREAGRMEETRLRIGDAFSRL